jgi:hypothetical protein
VCVGAGKGRCRATAWGLREGGWGRGWRQSLGRYAGCVVMHADDGMTWVNECTTGMPRTSGLSSREGDDWAWREAHKAHRACEVGRGVRDAHKHVAQQRVAPTGLHSAHRLSITMSGRTIISSRLRLGMDGTQRWSRWLKQSEAGITLARPSSAMYSTPGDPLYDPRF